MHRLQSPALGFMPDMGTYVERFPRVVTDHARRQGGREDLLDLIVATYDAHGDVHGLMDTVYYMGGGPIETGMARQATHYTWNDPRNMLDYMPYIHHIQAKFYEMTDEGVEYSIPYDKIIPVLIEGGYSGYLSSEYEGNRHIQDAFEVDSLEQVRRQHAMFQRLLGDRHRHRRKPEGQTMFDKYIIVPEGFRNTTADGAGPEHGDGYELGIRLPYYRGLGLSMVEAIDLTVDGTPVPAEALTLTVHGNSYAVTRTVHRLRRPLGDGRNRHPAGRSTRRPCRRIARDLGRPTAADFVHAGARRRPGLRRLCNSRPLN